MKIILFSIIAISILFSCSSTNSNKEKPITFEKSQKEQNQSFSEYLDSTTNIYSNFKYQIAFDGPDNWKSDAGVSEHTIFRTYQSDSSFTFSINVIELNNLDEDNKKSKVDIWEFYKKNKQQMDYPFTTLLEEQLKTKINDFNCQHSYLKNNSSLKRKFNYSIKDLDLEYNITIISYQTFVNERTYTFTLNIPTLFYNENQEYYERLFGNIYFLNDGERLEELLKSISE